jgi:transposase
MSLICDCDREITATTREIDARAKADERVKVLCQIRGVGRYTAMLVIAEVGEVSRFPPPGTCARGRGSRRPYAARTAKPAWGTSPTRAPRFCAGR